MAMINVPYADLYRIHSRYKNEIDARINECIRHSQFINGPQLLEFENSLSNLLGKPSVGVANGTAAQQLSLLACNIGPGDEVIVPSMTFFSTAEAVTQVGAVPVFCDINLDDYTINVAQIESLITQNTKAIIAVDLYGQQPDYELLTQICKHYNLFLIQDSAQSFGSERNGNCIGFYSDLAIHSFYPGKNLGSMGDAGGITGHQHLIDRVKLLRDHGRKEKYVHEIVGWNHRLDGMQAAILNAKLPHINELNASRKHNAQYYLEKLKNTPLVLPQTSPGNTHVYNQFCVLYQNRDELRSFLLSQGIEPGIQFPLGCHQQPAYSHYSCKLPNTEKVARECLSLPVFPFMTLEELDYVCSMILVYFSSK